MDTTGLKQYLTKELQHKRFLSDSLDAVKAVESLETRHGELTQLVKELTEQYTKAAAKIVIANDAVKAAEDAEDEANKAAVKIIEDAKIEAAGLVQKARNDAVKLTDSANAVLKQLNKTIADKKIDNNALDNETVRIKAENETIKAEKQKLLAKLGG